jgi:hypothetical protein
MAGIDQANMDVRDALDHARQSAQDLHAALTDAATRRGGVLKADLAALPDQARAIERSVRHSLAAQNVITKQAINEAVATLHATHLHIAAALASSGQAAQTLIQQSIFDARVAVEKITEAVAATRASARAHAHAD